MHKRLKISLLLSVFLTLITKAFGQDADNVPMADQFREDGKIYVVVFVVALLLAGLLIYLMVLDRRVRKVEKDTEEIENEVEEDNAGAAEDAVVIEEETKADTTIVVDEETEEKEERSKK